MTMLISWITFRAAAAINLYSINKMLVSAVFALFFAFGHPLFHIFLSRAVDYQKFRLAS